MPSNITQEIFISIIIVLATVLIVNKKENYRQGSDDLNQNQDSTEEGFEFNFFNLFKVKWKRLTKTALFALIIILIFVWLMTKV